MQKNCRNMKWTFCLTVLCYGTLIVADYNYVALLNELGMSNPVIVGEKSKLRSKEMFHLMKDVMKLNQTIFLTTNIRNISLLKSPGIAIESFNDNFKSLFDTQNMNANIKRPWIIVTKNLKKYSRIDEPLYFLANETLLEHYELKSMTKTNALGTLLGKEFEWNKDYSKDFFERRANFEGITLLGMTDTEMNFNQLPKGFENIAMDSIKVPNTKEVRPFQNHVKGSYPRKILLVFFICLNTRSDN